MNWSYSYCFYIDG